jgi:hypothetical protein
MWIQVFKDVLSQQPPGVASPGREVMGHVTPDKAAPAHKTPALRAPKGAHEPAPLEQRLAVSQEVDASVYANEADIRQAVAAGCVMVKFPRADGLSLVLNFEPAK